MSWFNLKIDEDTGRTEDAMSTTPQQLGQYELQALLGKGSVGEVWKAYDRQMRRNVAVKILHPDLQSDPHFLAHFSQQGRTIVSLQHANIVQVYDVNIDRSAQSNEATAYIAMEYVEGHTLADYLHATSHRGHFPSIAQLIYFFTSLGLALNYLHQQGIVHGNIKPGNILLDRQNTIQFEAGDPKFCDIGLEQLLSESVTIASPFYMAPEQAKGQKASKYSDIYALGVILYEMCTGVQPFRAESPVTVMSQHISVLPTPPILINPHIPPALSEVILRAMAKDPVTRFSSGSSFAAAIAEACSQQPTRYISPEREFLDAQASQPSLPILGVSQPLTDSSPLPQPNTGKLTDPRILFPRSSASNSTRHSLPLLSSNPALPSVGQTPTGRQVVPSQSERTIVTPIVPEPAPIEKETTIKVPFPAQNQKSSDSGYLPPISSYLSAVQQPTSQMPQASSTTSIPLSSSTGPAPIPRQWPRRESSSGVPIYFVVAALLALLLVFGSVIGANLLLNNKPAASVNTTSSVFLQDDALGSNDQLRFDMQNVTPPPAGQSYFAWLQTTNKQNILLGQLTVQNQAIAFIYPGDSHHTNLLSIMQGILITQEDAGNAHPTAPTGKTIYRGLYSAAMQQALSNMLYITPNFPGHQSVISGLLDTIKSMNDKAGSVVDSLGHDPGLVRRQATRILEQIDGSAYAKSNGDLPHDVQPLLNTQVGLLSSPGRTGYIDTLATQLSQLQQTVDSKDTQVLQHIQNAENSIQDLRAWIQQIRSFAREILTAPNLNSMQIANDAQQLQSLANDAYTGRTIPPHQSPQPTLGSAGAYQAYVESQYMATINLQKV
jgi:serine/threonine protein kinase